MSLQRFLPHTLVIILILGAISCNDDWLRSEYDTTIQWEGGYEGPLVFGNLSLEDLLERYDTTGYVFADENNLLWASYSRDTVLSAPDVLEIPDQEFIQVFFRVESDIPSIVLGPTFHADTIRGFEFERTGDERLDSVYVKAGEMRIYVKSTIKHAGTLTITSEDVKLNGENYREVVTISNSSGTFEQTVYIDMAGGIIYLRDSAGISSLNLLFELDMVNSGNDILASEEVQIINSFHNLEFQSAYGYIGQLDTLLIDKAELEFDILEGNFEGTIKLADPQLHIKIDNSMGVPFAIDLHDLEAHYKDGSGTAISIDAGTNPIKINAPTINQIGESILSDIQIDNTNSTIHLAATTDLSGFQYSVGVQANPDLVQDNFILDNSELAISLEGLIPLDLRIQDVVLGDTFDFELLSGDEDSDFGPDDIDSIRIDMITKNHMPLDMAIQVYFVDTTRNWLKVDSLFGDDNVIFEAGEIDANGKVISETEKATRVELSRSQIQNILDANKLLMKAYVNTFDSQNRDVKFHSGDYLDFKLGTRLKLNITLESEQNN